MNAATINDDFSVDRELLEQLALEEICACQYYDLADCIDITSDHELIKIVNRQYVCDMYGFDGGEL